MKKRKALIVYSPAKEGTKCAAQTIFDSLFIDKEMVTANDMPKDLSSYDIVFAGFWMDDDRPTADGRSLLSRIEDKNVALFGLVPYDPTTSLARDSMRFNRELLQSNNLVLGEFICHGRSDQGTMDSGDVMGLRQFSKDMFYSLRS